MSNSAPKRVSFVPSTMRCNEGDTAYAPSNGQTWHLQIEFMTGGSMLLIWDVESRKGVDAVKLPSSDRRDLESALNDLVKNYGRPEHIITANSAEFNSHPVRRWVRENAVHHHVMPRGLHGMIGAAAVERKIRRSC